MTQASFNFALSPHQEVEEIQKWVERHNDQVILAARDLKIPVGSLLAAIDEREAKSHAVYLLRMLLNQSLRKSMGSRLSSFKIEFLQALRAEISIKRNSQNPALSLRNVLINRGSSQ